MVPHAAPVDPPAGCLGSPDRDRIRRAVHELHDHIAKEEDGLFPASLTALGGDEWDTAMAAWQQAHPERQLISDAHVHDRPGADADSRASGR